MSDDEHNFDDILTRIILTVKDDDGNYVSAPTIGHGLGSQTVNGSFIRRVGVQDGEMITHMIFESLNIEDNLLRHDSLEEFVEYLEDQFNQDVKVQKLPAEGVMGYE